MATKFEVQTVFSVSGVAALTAAFSSIQDSATNLKAKFGDFTSAVGSSITKIAELGAAAVTAAAGVVALAEHNAEAGEAISKLGDITGVSTDKLQELGFVGSQVGVSQDDLSTGLKKFSVQLGQFDNAQKGATASAKTLDTAQTALNDTIDKAAEVRDADIKKIELTRDGLENNGIATEKIAAIQAKYNDTIAAAQKKYDDLAASLADAATGSGTLYTFLSKNNPALLQQLKAAGSTGAAFDVLTAAMRNMTNETDRNALAIAAFGKGGINLTQFAKLSAVEVDNLSQKAHTLGIVLSSDVLANDKKLVQATNELHLTLSGVSQQLTGALLPALILGTKGLTDFAAGNREKLIKLVSDEVEHLTEVAVGLFQLFDSNGKAQGVNKTAVDIYNGFEKFKAVVTDTYAEVEKLYDWFNQLTTSYTGFSAQQVIVTLGILKFTGLLDVGLTAIRLLVAVFPLLGSVAVGALTAIATATEFLLSPAGLLILGLAAAAAAINYVVQQFGGWKVVWEEFKTLAAAFGQQLIDLFPNVGQAVVDAFTKATAIIEGFFTKLSASYQALIGLLSHPIATAQVLLSGSPTAPASGGDVTGFADGGSVGGSGSGDTQAAMLTPGEFVLKTGIVKKLGTKFLDMLNGGGLRGFADGGLVGGMASSSSLSYAGGGSDSGGLSGRPLTLQLPSGRSVQTNGVSESVARQLEQELRASANAKSMKLPGWY